MDEHEFEAFYENCVNLVLHKYLSGTDRQDLIEEVQKFK